MEVVEDTKKPEDVVQEQEKQQEQKQIKLVDVEIKDENTALNVLVSFVQYAHAKGVFGIQESAKIWECINKFQGPR
tara:strand:+ start:718 stop:945 length:228 start_codon:yes stop_codon:yes gene_type:complete